MYTSEYSQKNQDQVISLGMDPNKPESSGALKVLLQSGDWIMMG